MALAFDLHGGRWFVERRAPDPPHALRICKQRGEARRHLPGEASIAGTAEAAIPVSDADPRKAGLGYTDAAPLGIWTRL